MLSHFICANVRHRAGNKEYEKLLHLANDQNDFAYDSASRLTSFERDTNFTNEQTDADWTLDGVGNWETLERTINSSPVSRDRTANTFNEYATIHTTAQTHDLNGNLTASGFGDYYRWDGLNRLSILRDDDLWPMYETTYLYTADNRRVGKINGVYNTEYIESFTEFALAGWQVLHEIDLDMSGNGQEENVRTFVYGNYIDEPLRMENLEHDYYYDHQNPPAAADGWVPMHSPDTDPTDPYDYYVRETPYFYHQNTLFSVAALTDEDGVRVEGYVYDPYGQHLTFTDGDADGDIDFSLATDTVTRFGPSAIKNPYTFTGRRVDEESGLLYYRNRMYSTSRGRFISQDPWGYGDGLGLLEYVKNNPVLYMDPTGKYAIVSFLISREILIVTTYDDVTDRKKSLQLFKNVFSGTVGMRGNPEKTHLLGGPVPIGRYCLGKISNKKDLNPKHPSGDWDWFGIWRYDYYPGGRTTVPLQMESYNCLLEISHYDLIFLEELYHDQASSPFFT